ncbi:MAG: D-alanyl-D-alanine carboxypeptidase [Clostridia bacterium]|nr:D-alanyl-D-alanine carboxypeptidase [Clostridia bacterium]
MRKKLVSVFLSILLVLCFCLHISALSIKEPSIEINAKSAVLMDVTTGTVLYEKNMNQALPPASVTKIMTLLLTFEAIEGGKLKYDQMLTVSENAASMGGSQVFLEPGEQMSVNELIKCVVVSSANDAAVTLAEHIGGSEEAFIAQMNKRASELGMKNTHFENATGLDDDVTNHLTSAFDIAVMSRELLKHEKITDYTTIWMDTIRNGEFGLSNTNKLVKSYRGITGLKTGYTSGAGFCISASAKRGEMHLVTVIMGAETSNERNIIASKLLNFGFANYEIINKPKHECGTVKVKGGAVDSVRVGYEDFRLLENLGASEKITSETKLPEYLNAPIKSGEAVGKIVYKLDGKIIGEMPIIAYESVKEITFFELFGKVFENFILN